MVYLLMLFHSTVQNRAYTQLYVFIINNEFFKERIRLSSRAESFKDNPRFVRDLNSDLKA